MLRKFAYLPLLACLIYPAAGFALGLGEIRVDSALNQPLDAEIALTNVRAGELDALQIRLAPPESFSRVGLDRPFVLTQLRFEIARDAAGQPVVKVTTRDEVREPFLNFLIEASWARGRLLREYTLLLDPPVLMPAVVEPIRPAEATRTPVARDTAPTPAETTQPRRTTPAPMLGRIPDDRMRAGSGEYGPVQRDETLWSIAERVKPSADISTSQMMLALFEANPDAFYGNINSMKTGYVLRVPGREEIARRAPDEAYREAARQNEAWRLGQVVDFVRVTDAGPAATEGQLRLTAPGSRDAGTDPAGTATADPELQRELSAARGELSEERAARGALAERLAELEAETQELRRMLQIRDAELEALTGQRPEPVAAAEPVETVDTTETAEVAEPVVEPAVQAERPAPQDTRRVVPPPIDEAPGLMGLLTNPLVIALLLGIPIVIALALVALRRRRSAAEANKGLESGEDEYVEGAEDATVFEADASADADAETVVGGGVVAPDAAGAKAAAAADEGDDESLTASAVMKLDEGDPASEADFHLAYGLYDQAAELMEGAYAQHPDRVDFLMKLLEIYFAWGKAEEFVRHARDGRAKLEAAGEWGNVAILGRQMNADEALFTDMGSTGARSGVDLDLEGSEADGGAVDLDTGEFESEFDLGEPEADAPAETPAAPAADAGNEVEFDLGDFEYETDAAAETPADETQAIEVDATQAIDLDALPAADETEAEEADAADEVLDFDESDLGLPDEAEKAEQTQFKVETGNDDGGMDLDLDEALAGLEAESDNAGIESGFSDEAELKPAVADDNDTPADAGDAEDDGFSLDFDSMLEGDADADGGDEAPASSDSRLDLARAYIDMGDADGARTLLNEVLADGDDAQKGEAKELLALIS